MSNNYIPKTYKKRMSEDYFCKYQQNIHAQELLLYGTCSQEDAFSTTAILTSSNLGLKIIFPRISA